MEIPIGTLVVLGLAAGALGWGLRLVSGRRDEGPRMPMPPVMTDEAEERVDELTGVEDRTAAALTSDGWVLMPQGDGVRLIPPAGDEDDAAAACATGVVGVSDATAHLMPGLGAAGGPGPRGRISSCAPPPRFDRGDLVGARVMRGAPDVDPWRLEAIGRDGDYRALAFETEDAARAALDLLARRVVRVPRDADGNAMPPTAGDFAEARRRDEETAALLASMPEDEPEYE